MSEQEVYFRVFTDWLRGATRGAIAIMRDRIDVARAQAPAVRPEANRLIRAITQELAARGEYDKRHLKVV